MIEICNAIRDENGTYSKYTGVMLKSLLENTKSDVRVHIFHDDTLTENNKEKLTYVVEQEGGSILFYPVEMQSLPVDHMVLQRYSKAALYRLMAPQILPNDVKKILYLDSDIIVNLDIETLWNEKMEDAVFVGFCEYDLIEDGDVEHYFCDKGCVSPENYINSGAMLVDLQYLREENNLIEKCNNFFSQYPKSRFLDQDALNVLYRDRIRVFSQKLCKSSVLSRRHNWPSERVIYHFCGDSPRDFSKYAIDQLFFDYLIKTPWMSKEEMFYHYSQRIYDKNKQIEHVYRMMKTIQGNPQKKIVYWGVGGKIHPLIMRYFSPRQGDYYVDNDTRWWGREINGIKVNSPEQLKKEAYDDIIIINTIFRYNEVKKQLEKYGYQEGIHFFNAKYLLREEDICIYAGERVMPWDM